MNTKEMTRAEYPSNEELVAAIRGEMGLDAVPLDVAFRRDVLSGMSDPSEWDETTLLTMRFARKFFEQGWHAALATVPTLAGNPPATSGE